MDQRNEPHWNVHFGVPTFLAEQGTNVAVGPRLTACGELQLLPSAPKGAFITRHLRHA